MSPRKKMEGEVAKLEAYIAEVQCDANDKRKKLSAAKAPKEEHWAVTGQEQCEIGMYHGEIVVQRAAFWQSEARKHFIELPPKTDENMWQEASGFGETLYLSSLGVLRIRNAIKKKRREHWAFVGSMFGTIGGVLIALLSLIVAVLALKYGK